MTSRQSSHFAVKDFQQIKLQMLNWANQFNICCFLDNHHYQIAPHSFECLLAAGAYKQIAANSGNAFQELKDFSDQHTDWMFGHFGYDLKAETEQIPSQNLDHIKFPDLFFFVPEIIIQLNPEFITISSLTISPETILKQIKNCEVSVSPASVSINMQERFSRNEYISTVEKIQRHILRGDCYELNFCVEFFQEHVAIDPLHTYLKLAEISPNPFSVYYRLNDKWLLCASPERYMKKTGNQLLSQPVKGTSKRNPDDQEADKRAKSQLLESSKERAENVMIVDLVRNDLSRVCEEGSVQVDELFGVYDFPQVHQLISSISGKLKQDKTWGDAIRETFPMGSMTGAPKNKVLSLIEQYERTRRGIFSGSIGYVTPELDFDFNVVIRSIMYNQTEEYLSCQVGSGITFYSDPELEYEECQLKLEAIKKVLASQPAP